MFNRSILLPSLVVCVIAAPFLFSNARQAPELGGESAANELYGNSGVYLPTGISENNLANSQGQSGSLKNYQNAPIGNPAFQANNGLGGVATNPALGLNPSGNSAAFANSPPQTVQPGIPVLPPGVGPTQVFAPSMSLSDIFRLGVDPSWVKARWNRISTSPESNGLHGFRVALVTGTNPWDLHGSLTYFFDKNQRAQRVTFRGWTSDTTQLVNLVTSKFKFKEQPTHWAGFYLVKSWGEPIGALLMQNPPVIFTDNPAQQVAVALEINGTNGKFTLSEDFRWLIKSSRNAD